MKWKSNSSCYNCLTCATERTKHPCRISAPPAPLPIIDSAAQMVEPQMCNNSIKHTSPCFHKVRHTQRHPLEFHILLLAPWTHPKEYCSVKEVTNTVCVCLLIITFLTKTYPAIWGLFAESICSHVIRRGCTEFEGGDRKTIKIRLNLYFHSLPKKCMLTITVKLKLVIKETAAFAHGNIKVLINKKGIQTTQKEM